ncbi:hypothetical protein [Nannocystis pusilla]|uniref:hypothetical protein n=1 Tax=Nannocystis pusilla TaxID=889268 RepID=UPI003B7F2A81
MLGSLKRKRPRDAPSRISVRPQAGEIAVTCHDETRTVREVEALAAEMARCPGPESSYLDLSAAPDTPLQRVVDVALAGRPRGAVSDARWRLCGGQPWPSHRRS